MPIGLLSRLAVGRYLNKAISRERGAMPRGRELLQPPPSRIGLLEETGNESMPLLRSAQRPPMAKSSADLGFWCACRGSPLVGSALRRRLSYCDSGFPGDLYSFAKR